MTILDEASKDWHRFVGTIEVRTVPAILEAVKCHEPFGNGRRDVDLVFDGRRGIVFSTEHERRALNICEPRQEVASPVLIREEVHQYIGVHDAARHPVRIRKAGVVVRHALGKEGAKCGERRVSVECFCTCARIGTTEPLENGEVPLGSKTSRSTRKNQSGWMIGMPCRIHLRDEPPEGLTHHDRTFDAKYVTQAPHIVRPLVEVPALGRRAATATIAAVIDVDELRHVTQ